MWTYKLTVQNCLCHKPSFLRSQSNEHLEYMIQYNIIAVMDTQHRHEEFFEADRKMLPRGKKRK